jgi:Uma2 family endonuclease
LYERFAVPEYWYVDLEAERIEVQRLADGAYPVPSLRVATDALNPSLLPGLALDVAQVLNPYG